MSSEVRGSKTNVQRVDAGKTFPFGEWTLDGKTGTAVSTKRRDRIFREAVPEYKVLLAGGGSQVLDAYLVRCLDRWADVWALHKLRDITPDDVREYLEDLSGREHTREEVRRERSLLQSFFRWAKRSGWADMNPVCDIRHLPRDPRQRGVTWSGVEQMKLLRACSERWNSPGQGMIIPPKYLHPLVLLALRTGLRLGNLLTLEWRHVDFISCRILIPATEVRSGRNLKVPLSIDALQTLHGLVLKARKCKKMPRRVFAVVRPPARGSRYDKRQVISDFRYARKRARITEGDFKSLRLTFLRNCAHAGVPPQAAAQIADWEDVGTIAEIYREHAPSMVQRPEKHRKSTPRSHD